MRRIALAVWALVAMTSALAWGKEAAVGEVAPAFTLSDLNGKPHSLSDYKGKVVVLEWTNPQCPIVQRHYRAGTMKQLQAKYGEKGVVWLAINSSHNETLLENQAWAKQQDIKYPILLDAGGEVGKAYGAKTTPHMYVIDESGKLVYRGGIDNDPTGDKGQPTPYVANALDEVLSGKAVSVADTKPYGCSVKYAR